MYYTYIVLATNVIHFYVFHNIIEILNDCRFISAHYMDFQAKKNLFIQIRYLENVRYSNTYVPIITIRIII